MKIPRGVYYLKLSIIIKSIIRIPFLNLKNFKHVPLFEKKVAEILGVSYAVTMPHARIALYYILDYLKLNEDDEIILSPVTLPDMLNMILIKKARPVFIDFKNFNHSICLEELKSKISDKTKVIYLTHLYGILPNLEKIREICEEKQIILIQDITQSYGCEYLGSKVCNWADYSFSSTCSLKEIHTHMGGLILTNDDQANIFFKRIKEKDFHYLDRSYYFKFIKEDLVASLALNKYIFTLFLYNIFSYFFNRNPKHLEDLIDGRGIEIFNIKFFKGFFAGTGDFLREEIPHEMKYHFTNHQAMVGLEMIEEFKIKQAKRIQNSKLILSLLNNKVKKYLPNFEKDSLDVYWRLPIYVDDIVSLEKKMFKAGFDPGKTTLPCLPDMDIYKFLNQNCPVASRMGAKTIYIPNFHYLSHEEIEKIAELLNHYFESDHVS